MSEKMVDELISPNRTYFVWPEQFLTDPAFWQTLGKALGWVAQQHLVHSGDYSSKVSGIYFTPGWTAEWYRFIDHLAEGKSADDFFLGLDASNLRASHKRVSTRPA